MYVFFPLNCPNVKHTCRYIGTDYNYHPCQTSIGIGERNSLKISILMKFKQNSNLKTFYFIKEQTHQMKSAHTILQYTC